MTVDVYDVSWVVVTHGGSSMCTVLSLGDVLNAGGFTVGMLWVLWVAYIDICSGDISLDPVVSVAEWRAPCVL